MHYLLGCMHCIPREIIPPEFPLVDAFLPSPAPLPYDARAATKAILFIRQFGALDPDSPSSRRPSRSPLPASRPNTTATRLQVSPHSAVPTTAHPIPSRRQTSKILQHPPLLPTQPPGWFSWSSSPSPAWRPRPRCQPSSLSTVTGARPDGAAVLRVETKRPRPFCEDRESAARERSPTLGLRPPPSRRNPPPNGDLIPLRRRDPSTHRTRHERKDDCDGRPDQRRYLLRLR